MPISFVTYRLWCLRRLIALAAVMPVVGAIIAGMWGDSFASREAMVWLGGLSAVGAGLVLVRWPGSVNDVLGLSLSLAVMVALSPLMEGPQGHIGLGWTIGFMLMWLALALVLIVMILPMLVPLYPLKEYAIRTAQYLPLPPAQAREALALGPEMEQPHRVTSPADGTGWFEVRMQGEMFQPDPETGETPVAYSAKVLSEDAICHAVMSTDASGEVSIQRQRFEPSGQGTLYLSEEVTNHLTAWLAFTFWLQDFSRDHLRGNVDTYLNRPTPAIYLARRETLLSALVDGLANWLGRRAAR